MNLLDRKALPDAIICLNGDLPPLGFFEHLAHIPIIAADGATNTLFAKGVVPDIVVGDLDSIHEDILHEIAPLATILARPDQDSNDFEKALVVAQQMLHSTLFVVGFHGGDLEHSLNNWSVLMRYGSSMNISVVEGRRHCFPVYSSVSFQALPDETVSLIPQPIAQLTTKGLAWPLVNEELALGIREGARNRATDDTVEIHVHSGAILLAIDIQVWDLPSTIQPVGS